jgi:hypothetical protein
MPNFMIAYLGGRKAATPEEGAAHMGRWKEWVANLGDAVVNPGTPLMQTKFLIEGGGEADIMDGLPLTGFSVVKAEDMDSAMKMASGCPFLEMGSLQISQMMEM